MFSSFSLGKEQFLLKGHQTETDFRLERDLSASLVTSEMFHPGSPFPIAEFIFMLHKQIRPQRVTMTDDDHTSTLLPHRIIDTSYLWLIVDWHINIVFTSSSSLVLTARKKQEMAIQRRYLGRAWKREIDQWRCCNNASRAQLIVYAELVTRGEGKCFSHTYELPVFISCSLECQRSKTNQICSDCHVAASKNMS